MTEPIHPFEPVMPELVIQDAWQGLRQFTSARIGLGRAGTSLTTQSHLDFQLAHALARDAVNIPLDFEALAQQLQTFAYSSVGLQTQAKNQAMYLQRPDLGRQLSATAVADVKAYLPLQTDVVIVIADGLSSKAIEHHAVAFLSLLLPELQAQSLKLAPLCLVKHGRVAIGDAIADIFKARFCIVLIGERPGLSSPDSMGIYFTYQAQSGISTDADRNCISNIHAQGLSYQQALQKLCFLLTEAERLQLSGVNLKDESAEVGLTIAKRLVL